MLHDLARLYSTERLLEEAKAHNIEIDAYAQAHPIVLHAPLSAALAHKQFGIDDAQILSAISKHTLAAGRMSPLDCILYLADGLEPGRNFEERAALASLARHDLAAAMRGTLRSSFQYLREKGLGAAPATLAAAAAFGLSLNEEDTTDRFS